MVLSVYVLLFHSTKLVPIRPISALSTTVEIANGCIRSSIRVGQLNAGYIVQWGLCCVLEVR